MSVWNRPAWLAMMCALWPGAVLGQVMFSETFDDGAAAGRWLVREDGDEGVPDVDVQLNFNYGSLGIAPAPRGTGTLGGKLDANVTGAGGAEGVNIYPVGQSFGGDFVLRFDVWARVAGDPNNSTEDFLGGINASGSQTNWLSSGGVGTDGLFHGATGNGWNTGGFDYVRYIGNPAGDPWRTPLFNNTDLIPQTTFPNTSGTPQNQWVMVDIEQVNGSIGLRLNGVTFDQYVNGSEFIWGNIFLGHQDVIMTAQGNSQTFSIFDNIAVTRVSRWLTDANGSWNLLSNWTVITAGTPGTNAWFGDVNTAPRTITLPSQQIVGSLVLDSPQIYYFNGPGAITLAATAGDARIDVRRGTHEIYGPVEFATPTRIDIAQPDSTLTIWSDPIAAPGVVLSKSGAGLLRLMHLRTDAVSVVSGPLQVVARFDPNDPGATSIVKSLMLAGPVDDPTATLDLTNTAMIIDHDGAAPLDTVRRWLRAGLIGGKGLITSHLLANRRLGYLDNISDTFDTFAGQSVDPTSLLIAYTIPGDANLDGRVDVADLARLGTHWLAGGYWMDGDFNYDGIINKEDLNLMALNWHSGSVANLSLSMIATLPEPGPGMVILLISVSFLRHRPPRPVSRRAGKGWVRAGEGVRCTLDGP